MSNRGAIRVRKGNTLPRSILPDRLGKGWRLDPRWDGEACSESQPHERWQADAYTWARFRARALWPGFSFSNGEQLRFYQAIVLLVRT